MTNKEILDIVQLIEKNPIIRLSKNYQGKFIEKIQLNFTESQQQLFVSSFYTFLNYNSKTDYIIDLESIWKWLGFSRKDPAKVVLEKNFIQNIDYKIITNKTSEELLVPEVAGTKKNTLNIYEETISQQPLENPQPHINLGGRPKEKILMNLNTFKKLCLKSNTKKADELHDYFIKLEELTQEIVNEESNELKYILQEKDLLLAEKDEKINELEVKPETEGFFRTEGYIYMVGDSNKPGHRKLGFCGIDKIDKRLGQLNVSSSTSSLVITHKFKTFDAKFVEEMIHSALQPFKIRGRKEWFYKD